MTGDSATIYIGGRWSATQKTFPVRDPATLEVLADVADAGACEAAAAADAAFAAFDDWSHATADTRSHLLHQLAASLENSAPAFEDLLIRESGKPRRDAAAEVASSGAFLRWSAEECRRTYGRTIPSATPDVRLWTLRQPIGVAIAITPWNYPLNTLCRKIGPALAAGCPVIMKPAEQTPLSTVRLFQLSEQAGFPAGVLNLVTTSKAAEVVAIWMKDARVRKIAFTGSTEVGRELYRAAADNFKRLSLELGGNAPALVFADADVEQAAAAIVTSRYRHAGQTCISVQRVFVEQKIAPSFADLLHQRITALRVGNGLDPATDLGPLIHEQALARVQAHLQDALAGGARLRAGGSRVSLPAPNRGCFFAPTLIDSARPEMKVMRDETFGPLLAVATFSSEPEAIRSANLTEYGLVAYVFTNDLGRAHRLIEQLQFGSVAVNTTAIVAPQLAFGGVKSSGLGKENGSEGIEEYLETKSAAVWIG